MLRYGTDGPCTCWGERFHRTESFFSGMTSAPQIQGDIPMLLDSSNIPYAAPRVSDPAIRSFFLLSWERMGCMRKVSISLSVPCISGNVVNIMYQMFYLLLITPTNISAAFSEFVKEIPFFSTYLLRIFYENVKGCLDNFIFPTVIDGCSISIFYDRKWNFIFCFYQRDGAQYAEYDFKHGEWFHWW